MNFLDKYSSYVPSTPKSVDIILSVNDNDGTISLETPILTYAPDDSYEGYIGYAQIVYSELSLKKEAQQGITLTVNEAAGVDVIIATSEGDRHVEFNYGKAEVEEAQYISIYSVVPYIITSVKVNGESIVAKTEGEYYTIQPSPSTKTIDITVEEKEVVEMSMMVTVENLYEFQELWIFDKKGEKGKAIAMEQNFTEGEPVQVWFTNFDLPLQVFGSWADGTDYKMVVTLDGEVIVPAQEGPTSALFVNIEPADGANMVIALTGAVIPSEKVTLTVNEAAGVKVIADLDEDVVDVEFANGKAIVEGAQYIRIFNVELYLLKSVKVNGNAIAAEEKGNYYFIEVTSEVKTIDITVEQQKVVEMSMIVYIEGLDKFENLAIMDKDGELGKALDSKMNFEDIAVDGMALMEVHYTLLDLPLQVFGSWADGTDYKMEVTLDGEALSPVQEGPTSALFMNIEPTQDANMVISLTSQSGSQTQKGTVNLTLDPLPGTVSELTKIFIDAPGMADAIVNWDSEITISNEKGTVIRTITGSDLYNSSFDWNTWQFIGFFIDLTANPITENGKYTVNIPQGMFQFWDGSMSKALSATYTVDSAIGKPAEKVTLTVNEAAGVKVIADLEEDVMDVEFANGKAIVEGAQYIRIYNVEPYLLKSVKVNGETITAQEEGHFYFIEANGHTKTIEISVEEQQIVEMTMKVLVEGLDRFVSLHIMNYPGEIGHILATHETLVEGVNTISVDNFDLPLHIYGTWAYDTNYQMEVSVDNKVQNPVMVGPTSAQYIDIPISRNQQLKVSLKADPVTEAIEKAANADRQILQNMKTELEKAAKDYSAYVDKSKYDALVKSIDDLDKKVTEAYNTALVSGKYTTPWSSTEIATLQKNVADFIQELKDAKENQDNQKIIEAIQKAANADRNAVKAVQNQWESVVNQTAKDYAAYVSAFSKDKETIDSKLAKVSSDIDTAQKKATDNLSTYESPSVTSSLSEISSLITKYQNDVKAAYDKAQQEAEMAANADRQVLQSLRDELEQASADYSAYINKNKYNALVKSIDDWSKKVTEAYNTALSSGNKYATPWTSTEINALKKDVFDFIQTLKDAKETDENQQIVEEITKAANADREALQKLRTEWEQVLAELDKKYPGFTIAFDKANIDAKFSKVSADIDAAQKKAVDALSKYESPSVTSSLNEIKGLIDKYKEDVEKAVERIKTNAATAAENDREAVKSAREASQSVIDATDRKYPAFVIESAKNNIYNRYDKLSAEIENAYNKAIETLSAYVSPSVSATLSEIDALVSQYQKDVAAAAEKAKEDASKVAASDKTTLSSLTSQIDKLNSTYAPLGCIDTQKLNAIKTTIQSLEGKVDTALSEIYTTGKYQTPWTTADIQKIKDDISALEADCNSRLKSSIDTASKDDLDKVANLKIEYDKMIASLHEKYAGFCDHAKEKAIADMFTTITNKINEAVTKAQADTKLYVSPDVDNYLENTINAQMQSYREEVLQKAYATMSEADKAATQDRETLKTLKSNLERAANDYAKYVDKDVYNSLCQAIDDWNDKVDKAYEEVAQTGNYTSPWTQDQLETLQQNIDDFITGLRNAKEFDKNTTEAINGAAEADRQALKKAQEAWEKTLSETNSKYPAFASETAKKAIEDKFTSLSSNIDQAQTSALESMTVYASPSVGSILLEISEMVTKYEQDVEAAANKAMEEANKVADVDRARILQLTEQLNGLNSSYTPIDCMDTSTFIAITASIKELSDLIDPALNAVYTTGSYRTPWATEEIQYILQSIRNLEGVCKGKLQNLVDEAANSDRDKVDSLMEDFLSLLENPHKFYANLCDPTKEREINDMLDGIKENITLAAAEAMENIQLYESPDVESSLDQIFEQMGTYKQDIIDRLVVEEAEILRNCDSKLKEIYESYKELLDMEIYESLCEAVNELSERLQKEGEQAVFITSVYDTPWTDEEIGDIWNAILNLEYDCFDQHWIAVEDASNEDRIKVNTVKDEFKVLCEYLHSEYPEAYNIVMENEIAVKLEKLLNQINQEASDAQNNKHPYNSPNVDQTLEEIRNDIDAYENYVRGSVLSDEEIERLVALESKVLEELESRLEEIFNAYQDYLEMEEYESISDAINELFKRLEQAQEEAYNTHKYTTPWTQEETEELRSGIDELQKNAQDAGISNVEADEQEAIYYDLNGRRILHPTSGKLYIRIVNGKSQKVIL